MPSPRRAREYPRAERVERLAKEVLGEAIHDLKDPRVGFATVTGVRMSADLRHAKVYVSVLGQESERATTMEAIRHAASHLRSVLGREIRLKFTPQLEVVEDLAAQQGERIAALLRAAGIPEPEPGRRADLVGEAAGTEEGAGQE